MSPSWIARAALRTDAFKRGPATHDPTRPYTEWMHFCVFPEGITLLVNLSFRTEGAGGPLVPRVLVLAWDGGWHGEIDTYAPEDLDVAAGRIDARFARSGVRFVDGAYHVHAGLRRADVAVDVVLRPLVLPVLVTNARLAPGARFNWVTVPRLVADGTVTLRGRAHAFSGVPAYHDHNWGSCELHGDFAWEWGVVLPRERENPWSVVFVRLMDRPRARVFAHNAVVWKDASPWRGFRHRELRFHTLGSVRTPRVHTIPRELRPLVPGETTPVPRALTFHAEADGDHLEATLDAQEPARLVIPGARSPEVTVVNEAAAEMRVEGRLRGEPIELRGPAILEVVHG